jgi:hypothetical protein
MYVLLELEKVCISCGSIISNYREWCVLSAYAPLNLWSSNERELIFEKQPIILFIG